MVARFRVFVWRLNRSKFSVRIYEISVLSLQWLWAGFAMGVGRVRYGLDQAAMRGRFSTDIATTSIPRTFGSKAACIWGSVVGDFLGVGIRFL
jgi:hypothetical protein